MRLNRQEARRMRGLAQKLWEMSNEINQTAQYVRYADKPADLTLPVTQMIQMTRRLNLFRDQWLLNWLKDREDRLERWPKLWERYL